MSNAEMTTAEAAKILRNEKSTPEERSAAAAVMGKKGGSKKRGRVNE